MRTLPVEAERIAAHLRGPLSGRREEFETRMREAVTKYRLRPGASPKRYTCPFLEPDRSCALPFDVKPVGCLAFNPVNVDACDMDGARFAPAYAEVQRENEEDGFPATRAPIPVGVLAALAGKSPRIGPSKASRQKPTADEVAAARGPRPAASQRRDALPRILSKFGIVSRKKAEALVKEGRVTVNGVPRRDVLFKASPSEDRIAIDGKPVARRAPDAVFVVAHKPRGVVTTAEDPEGRDTVMDLVSDFAAPGLFPVGRLDRASTGLLLFTNDHGLADRLLDPRSHVEKTYELKVRGVVTEATLARINSERVRDGADEFEPLRAEVLERRTATTRLRVVLREGKNRQLRRQFAAFGHEVETLIRLGFGPLELGDLAPGAARALTAEEIAAVRGAATGRFAV